MNTANNTPEAAQGFFRHLVARFLNDANPILLKEMRVLLRTPLFVRGLFVGTAGVAILVLSIGGIAAGESAIASEVGKITFSSFTVISMMACFFFQVAASTSITLEREGKTFESVLLTGMSSWRFVLGKFQANFVVFSLAFVSVSPVLGLVFLFGGVGVSHVLLGLLYIALTLGLSVAFGIFVSAHAKSTRTSVGLSLGLGGVGVWVLFWIGGAMFALISLSSLSGAPSIFNDPFAAVSEALFTWPGLLFLVLFPVNTVGILVVGALLLATKRLASNAEDRFVGLRLWSAWLTVSTIIWIGIVGILSRGDTEFVPIAIAGVLSIGFIISHIFIDESPLPPAPLRAKKMPLHLRLFGPGAIPTVRFVTLFLVTLVGSVVTILFITTAIYSQPFQEVMHHLFYGLQGALVLISLYCIALATRLTVGRGTAGGVLYVAFLMTGTFFPTAIATQMSDGVSAMSLSPISPLVLIAEGTSNYHADELMWFSRFRIPDVLLNIALYGVMGLIAFIFIMRRVRDSRNLVEAQEVARQAARRKLDAQANAPLDRNAMEEMLRSSGPPGPEPGSTNGR